MLIANLIMGPSMNTPRRVNALPGDGYSMSGEVATLTAGESCTIIIVDGINLTPATFIVSCAIGVAGVSYCAAVDGRQGRL